MSYVTGSATTVAGLQAAITAACTANGWTLTGEVLSKGTAFIKVHVNGAAIEFTGGTGLTGSTLTGAAITFVRFADFSQVITYPLVYEVHINTSPDEVYVVINYATSFYQLAAWGLSNVPDLPGTGMWFGATRFGIAGGTGGDFALQVTGDNPQTSQNSRGSPLFIAGNNAQSAQSCFINHGLDSATWSPADSSTGGIPFSFGAMRPLIEISPGAWNSETVLLPFPVFLARSSGNTVSLVADLQHVRHARIDNHDPGDIVTLGSDKWKLYPWYRKNSATRNPNGSSISDSGTVAFAVRYTGP